MHSKVNFLRMSFQINYSSRTMLKLIEMMKDHKSNSVEALSRYLKQSCLFEEHKFGYLVLQTEFVANSLFLSNTALPCR